jgi:hypothetical protein
VRSLCEFVGSPSAAQQRKLQAAMWQILLHFFAPRRSSKYYASVLMHCQQFHGADPAVKWIYRNWVKYSSNLAANGLRSYNKIHIFSLHREYVYWMSRCCNDILCRCSGCVKYFRWKKMLRIYTIYWIFGEANNKCFARVKGFNRPMPWASAFRLFTFGCGKWHQQN